MSYDTVTYDIKDIIQETRSFLPGLEGKTILITGASGMLGSYLVRTLLFANKHVFKKPARLYLVIRSKKEPFGHDVNIKYLHLDIAREIPNLANIHYIIHAASKAAPLLYTKYPTDTLNTNILGLYHVLKLCGTQTKSILFFSSSEVYGTPLSNRPVKEEFQGIVDHTSKRASYVEAKRAGETICLSYFREKNFPVKIVRIFHTFGPGLNLSDGRIFSDFIRFGLEKKDITIQGDKKLKRAFLYIKDATIMFLHVLLSGKNGQIYNIGNDKNVVSVEKFAYAVAEQFNKRYKNKLKVIIDTEKNLSFYKGAVKAILPDINKFKKEFRYHPTTDINEAVGRTIDSYLP